MRMTTILAISLATMLAACETPTTQRYSILADNNVAIKALNATGVGISNFADPAEFDAACRVLGNLHIADGVSHSQYIQKAFESELKIAGAYQSLPARVTLSGKIDKLEFSSLRGITGGSWTIVLTLNSSNGESMQVNEYYEFQSGFSDFEACRNSAEAFTPAVQNLVGKTVQDPRFKALIK